jgi:hypothetical protein
VPDGRPGQLSWCVDLAERGVGGLEIGVLGYQRGQLVLERVVLGVGDRRIAGAVVQIVQPLDLGGQLLDAVFHRVCVRHASHIDYRRGLLRA